MAAKGTASTTRLRKIECEDCAMILRGSRGAFKVSGLPMCACGGRFVFPDPADAFACLADDAVYTQPSVRDELQRDDRRTLRESARRSAFVGQCGGSGCNVFITRTNQVCKCGFTNDLRGRRNHGQYGDPMPF